MEEKRRLALSRGEKGHLVRIHVIKPERARAECAAESETQKQKNDNQRQRREFVAVDRRYRYSGHEQSREGMFGSERETWTRSLIEIKFKVEAALVVDCV